MIDVLAVLALLHHPADKQRQNVLRVGAVLVLAVLVEREDEQAIVRLGPLDVAVQMVLQPGVRHRSGVYGHVKLCMSSSMLGITNDTLGSVL